MPRWENYVKTLESDGSKAMLWIGRILSGLVVVFMAMDGVMKLIQPPQVTEPSAKLGMTGITLTILGLAGSGKQLRC